MANLRKLIAAALTAGADLSTDPNEESAIDRIGAMAWSHHLGGELWRLREGNDASAYVRAVRLLVRATRRPHYSFEWYQKLCSLALQEWLYANCRTCGGSGIIHATEIAPTRVCTVCGGSGRGTYSDQNRMAQLGLTPRAYAKWRVRIDQIHERIVLADQAEYEALARQLERWAPKSAVRKALDSLLKRGILARGPQAHNENSMPDQGRSSNVAQL